MGWIGNYIVDKQPEVIICIGDFADMPSLSSYDVGKKSFEGRTYKADIEAANHALSRLHAPIDRFNAGRRKRKKAPYRPRFVLTLGNHEHRILRAIENDRKLDGTIGIDDIDFKRRGWEVHEFLEVVVIDGIAYSHYFTSGEKGLPINTARALSTKKHMSCTAGHSQKSDIDMSQVRADGQKIIGLMCGICYLHEEPYLGPQGNSTRRQIVYKHEVNDGQYDPMFVSLDFLKRKYS